MIDTHIHLTSKEYYTNPDQIIADLKAHGVECIINVATDIETSKLAVEYYDKFLNKSYATVGIHPEEIKSDINLQDLNILDKLMQNKGVVAVGEVGLDKTYIKGLEEKEFAEKFTWQLNFLNQQIQLAKKHNLPLILHSRETTPEMLKIIKSLKNEIKFVWHCFTENLEVAKQIIDNGGYISFTGIITYKNTEDLASVIAYIPTEKYMIETDGPFLTPEPLRKQKVRINMPWNIYYVAKKIAEIKNLPVDTVLKQTVDNSRNFFQI